MSNSTHLQQATPAELTSIKRQNLTLASQPPTIDTLPFPFPFVLRESIDQKPLTPSEHQLFLALVHINTTAQACAAAMKLDASSNLYKLLGHLLAWRGEFHGPEEGEEGGGGGGGGVHDGDDFRAPAAVDEAIAAKFQLVELLFEACRHLPSDDVDYFANFGRLLLHQMSIIDPPIPARFTLMELVLETRHNLRDEDFGSVADFGMGILKGMSNTVEESDKSYEESDEEIDEESDEGTDEDSELIMGDRSADMEM